MTAPLHQAAVSKKPPQAALIAVALVVAGIESVATWMLAKQGIQWTTFLLLHVVIVAVILGAIDRIARQGVETGSAMLIAFLIAATGPIGALASIAFIYPMKRRAEEPQLLTDWYNRIANAVDTDEVTRLCELVATGRTSDLSGTAPGSFTAIMDRGSLDDRQTALGVIARNFHPDYLPALLLALKNDEPVIRVQAAAVATKVRGQLGALIDRIAAMTGEAVAPGSPAALNSAAQLDAAAASGLLDESDRIRASALAGRLITMPAPPSIAILRAVPVVHRKSLEAALVASGQFSRLRVGRRIASVETGRAFRVRRAKPASPAKAS